MYVSDRHPGKRPRGGAPLIVHSHLRWDFVWQRPQQLLTRFASQEPVLYIEEPLFLDDIDEPSLSITVPFANVYRAVPHIPALLSGDYDAAIAEVRSLVAAELACDSSLGARFANAVHWFYTPMPAPAMLGAFGEAAVVYDCMDELAQFRFAHPDLARRERLLLSIADVVFTGGRKLWRAKAARNPNTHFFACGVDATHFAAARDLGGKVPPDLEDIRRTASRVAGYYGVIDERLDYGLVADLAASDADLAVVMVGPVVKVDPSTLPQMPNLHWIGSRSYGTLPDYVRGFDVCLMPFALNEATEYINPTKTLEYMAAGRPVVSTAIADVITNHSSVVRIAENSSEFVAAVDEESRSWNIDRINAAVRIAEAATWDSIVSRMRDLIMESVDGSAVASPARLDRIHGERFAPEEVVEGLDHDSARNGPVVSVA